MTGQDCPFIAVLRHGGEGRHLPPDLARWAEALSHAAGQTVPLLDDHVSEPAEVFLVTLSNPGGGATLGSFTVSQVVIVDDDVFSDDFETSNTSRWSATAP